MDKEGNVTEMTDENGGRTCFKGGENRGSADSTLTGSEVEIQTNTYEWNLQRLDCELVNALKDFLEDIKNSYIL